jgi:hypothetical protein
MHNDDPYRLSADLQPDPPHGPFRIVRPRNRGFRFWMSINEDIALLLSLVAAYAFIMLYLIALIAFGRETIVSRMFVGLVIVSALLSWFLFRASVPRRRLVRTKSGWHFRWQDGRLWRLYRPVRTERIERFVAAGLWGFIVIVVLLVLVFAAPHSK